jgi:hypothetical protein
VPPLARRAALVIHIASSVGWLGAVLTFLVLAVAAATAGDTADAGALVLAMDVMGWPVLVPLAGAAFVSGIVGALASPWGLLDHYWVVVKLVLTVLATAVLVLHLGPVESAADDVRDGVAGLGTLRERLVVQSAAALAVLLFATILSVFKPKGRTKRGARRFAARVGRRNGSDVVARHEVST